MEASEHDLVLSIRGAKLARRAGATTVAQLIQLTADELLSTSCFGMTSLTEINDELHNRGLRLGMTPADVRAHGDIRGDIVAVSMPKATVEDHHGPCCGDCDAAARRLQKRTHAGR